MQTKSRLFYFFFAFNEIPWWYNPICTKVYNHLFAPKDIDKVGDPVDIWVSYIHTYYAYTF